MKMRALALAIVAWAALSAPALGAPVITPLTSNQVGGSTTLARTGINIASGSYAVAFYMVRENNISNTSTVTDNLGNTFTNTTECNPASSNNTMFAAYRYYPSGLSSGTITLTQSVTMTAGVVQVFEVAGLPTSSPEDAVAAACNEVSSTTPLLASGTPSQAGNALFAMIGRFSSSSGFSDTEDTVNGWNATNYGTGNTNIVGVVTYQINAGSGVVNHQPTMGTASAWRHMIVAFKDASPPASGTNSRAALLGVGR